MTTTTWQVQEAKARFSALVDKAETEGPQVITRHGRERAVLLSARDYHALLSGQRDLRAWLLGGPKVDVLDIGRDGDSGREIVL